MGLADFVSQLLPQRWKDKFDSPEMPSTAQPGPKPTLERAVGMDGWGPNQDQPIPLIGFGKRLATDARETFQDLRDEPGEVPYRLRERAQSYFPQGSKFQYREGGTDTLTDPLGKVDNQIRPTLERTDTNVSPSALPPAITLAPRADSGGAISPTIDLPPMSEHDLALAPRRGRPFAGDSVSEIENWEPQGAKRSFGGFGKAFLRGGLPGALGNLIDPNQNDRQDKARMLGEADARDERSRVGRRQDLQERLLNQQVKNAETPDVIKPSYDWFPQDSDGDGVPDTEMYQERKPGSSRNIYRPEKTAAPHNPLLRDRTNPDGSKTTLQSDDYGVTWKEAPELGDAAPTVKPTADYAQRASWYEKRQGEFESRAKDLRDQAARVAAKPGYELTPDQRAEKASLAARAAKAEDNALEMRTKRDEAATEPATRGQGVSGRTMSRANLARYAKDHRMTVEQAQASHELQGVVIR